MIHFDGRNLMRGSRAIGNTYIPDDGELIGDAFRALEAVEACCRESFVDAGSPGNHRTDPICPLCGATFECDEDCPRRLVKKVLDKS